MAQMRDQLDHEAEQFGIEVVDVRIRRADLPEQNSQAVYQRMQTERQREAAEFRAQGSQKSQEIRAKADRDVTVLLADATSQAEQIRGQGDSERNRIFADAYNRDPDFFAFYRSMQAYEKSMQHGDTRLVLRPDSDFFRYFSDPSGRPAAVDGAESGGRRRTPKPRSPEIGFPRRRSPRQSARPSMSDFLAAIGLVFAIEGILFAAFPAGTKRAMAAALDDAGWQTAHRRPGLGLDRRCSSSGWCATNGLPNGRIVRVAFPPQSGS